MTQQQQQQQQAAAVAVTGRQAADLDLPVRIAGLGRHVPQLVVSNDQLLKAHPQLPLDADQIAKRLGVHERRRCPADGDESSACWMGARAAEEACRDAGCLPADIDLILNASGTPERVLPDNGPSIQRHLGLADSGIPCFSVHATCLSFMVGLKVAAALLATGAYRRVLLVSTENPLPSMFDPKDAHSLPLFGAMACAAVLERPAADSDQRISRFYMETFGDEVESTTVRAGSLFPLDMEQPHKHSFSMDGPRLLTFVRDNFPHVLEKVQPGLSRGELGSIAQVIPHQASGNGLRLLEQLFGRDRVVVDIFSRYGNTISCGIPCALYEAVRDGRVKRGDDVLLIGSGAGVSFAAMKLTY